MYDKTNHWLLKAKEEAGQPALVRTQVSVVKSELINYMSEAILADDNNNGDSICADRLALLLFTY